LAERRRSAGRTAPLHAAYFATSRKPGMRAICRGRAHRAG
jgi:hypothetical protein